MAKEKSWSKFLPPVTDDLCEDNLNEFFQTMYERQEIWYRRNVLALPRPWTENAILRDYKFTNVYRELDASSQFLIHNVIAGQCNVIEGIDDLLWQMIIYRFYNKPSTFEETDFMMAIPHYKDFKSQALWHDTVRFREEVGDPWHGAYLMNPTNLTKEKLGWVDGQKRGMFKDYVYVHHVFKEVHKIIPKLGAHVVQNDHPRYIIDLLLTLPAVAVFMATEFYLDITYIRKYNKKYQYYKYTDNDHYNAGPGAITGLRLIFPSLPKTQKEEGITLLREIAEDRLAQFGDFKYITWNIKIGEYERSKPYVSAHMIEMWLCEYQKYFKMRVGEGKQRSKFVPAGYTK